MENFTVVQLRDRLKLLGLKHSGKKAELLDRLLRHKEGKSANDDLTTPKAKSWECLSDSHAVRSKKSWTDFDDNRGVPGQGASSMSVVQHGTRLRSGNDDDRVVQPEDSVSQTGGSGVSGGSGRSRVSKASAVSVERAEAAAKRAALLARQEKLKKSEEIEQEQLKIKQRQVRLALETKIAEAADKEEVFSRRGSHLGSSICSRTSQRESKPILQRRSGSVAHSASGCSSKDKELLRTLVSYNLRSSISNQELSKFGGDVTCYQSFVKSFEDVISSRLDDDSEKLHYLHQFTEGKPKDIVGSCLLLPPEEGYKEARRLLHRRYRNPERIATAYVEKVLSWRNIGRDDIEALDEFAIMLTCCRNAVAQVPFGAAELQNPKTMRKIIEKLPHQIQETWRRRAHKISEEREREVLFNDLVIFVEEEARIVNNPLFGKQHFLTAQSEIRQKTSKPDYRATKVKIPIQCNIAKEEYKCWHCQGNHFLSSCNVLLALPYDKRFNTIKEMNVCFKCLRRGHMAKFCRRNIKCSTCGSDHQTILHRDLPGENKHEGDTPCLEEATGSNIGQEPDNVQLFASVNSIGLTMSVIPVRVQGNGRVRFTYAFLDSGSSATFCSASLMRDLGLDTYGTEKVQLAVSTIHGVRNMECSLLSGLTVGDMWGNNEIALPPVYVIGKIPVEKREVVKKADLAGFSHLEGVEIFYLDSDVDLMIGTNVPHVMEPWAVIHALGNYQPYALKTKFGWVVCGLGGKTVEGASVNRVKVLGGQELDKEMIMHYNRDFVDLSSSKLGDSEEDRLWLSKVQNKRKLNSGKYEIPLPIRDPGLALPNTKVVAERRLKGLRKRLLSCKVLEAQYLKFMAEVLEKEHAELVPESEVASSNCWYIPHFGVQHPDKPHKVRVVFDASARVGGVSLNDLLLRGPDLTNLLVDVLLRFREGKYAYTADVESMFYQVFVPAEQRNFLRFLWWPEGDMGKEPTVYRMKVHIFGACSSPSVANYALQQTALEEGDKFANNIGSAILKYFYVDDCL